MCLLFIKLSIMQYAFNCVSCKHKYKKTYLFVHTNLYIEIIIQVEGKYIAHLHVFMAK